MADADEPARFAAAEPEGPVGGPASGAPGMVDGADSVSTEPSDGGMTGLGSARAQSGAEPAEADGSGEAPEVAPAVADSAAPEVPAAGEPEIAPGVRAGAAPGEVADVAAEATPEFADQAAPGGAVDAPEGAAAGEPETAEAETTADAEAAAPSEPNANTSLEQRLRDRVAALDGIESEPLAVHAQRYDEVHAELQAALTEIDGESGG